MTKKLHAAVGPIRATRMTLETVKAFLRGWFPHWQMQLRAFDTESLVAWGLVLLACIWTIRNCPEISHARYLLLGAWHRAGQKITTGPASKRHIITKFEATRPTVRAAAPVAHNPAIGALAYLAGRANHESDARPAGRHQRAMDNQQTIKRICEQLKVLSFTPSEKF